MTQRHIRLLVICLFQHNGRILVSQDYDSIKQDYFCRPLGGGIEFGERGREALVREMLEELSAEIEDLRWMGTLENLFTLEGQPGHEIVLVYDARFVDRSLYERPFLDGLEHDINKKFIAEWKSLDELEQGTVRLVPEGLMDFLRSGQPFFGGEQGGLGPGIDLQFP